MKMTSTEIWSDNVDLSEEHENAINDFRDFLIKTCDDEIASIDRFRDSLPNICGEHAVDDELIVEVEAETENYNAFSFRLYSGDDNRARRHYGEAKDNGKLAKYVVYPNLGFDIDVDPIKVTISVYYKTSMKTCTIREGTNTSTFIPPKSGDILKKIVDAIHEQYD